MIENLDSLTPEQKIKVKEQLKIIGSSLESQEKQNKAKQISDHFKALGWVKIENVITTELANFLYSYCVLATQRLNMLEEHHGIGKVDKHQYGEFTDPQAPGDYSKYGDLVFDTLLYNLKNNINLWTDKNLIPTYSYHRLYTTGTELVRHTDRPSCEISTTLCLGYDTSNLNKKIYPNYNWPMYVKEKDGTEFPVQCKPGDMIIYRGCDLEHWRERYIGKNHAQVFLHYNDKEGEYNIEYDGRPFLGLPGTEADNGKKSKNTIY